MRRLSTVQPSSPSLRCLCCILSADQCRRFIFQGRLPLIHKFILKLRSFLYGLIAAPIEPFWKLVVSPKRCNLIASSLNFRSSFQSMISPRIMCLEEVLLPTVILNFYLSFWANYFKQANDCWKV